TTGQISGLPKYGAFSIGSYGICVELAPNTMVIWQLQNIHRTSLQNQLIDQEDPYFSQTGLAIVTSNRLLAVWA
ncbi:hypothetical protein EV363DRAFT_1170590, partial [Boletus edulis]